MIRAESILFCITFGLYAVAMLLYFLYIGFIFFTSLVIIKDCHPYIAAGVFFCRSHGFLKRFIICKTPVVEGQAVGQFFGFL